MHTIPFWKKIPSIRLVIPLMAGIAVQNECNVPPAILYGCLAVSLILLIIFYYVPLDSKFRLGTTSGLTCFFFIAATGSIIVLKNDVRQNKSWFGKSILPDAVYYVTIKDPPVEKANSFRATGNVEWIFNKNKRLRSTGRLILYFNKESAIPKSGTALMISKMPEPIVSSGNPGSFDFKTYCLYQGITHQIYVTSKDYLVISHDRNNILETFIQHSRNMVLNCLKRNINGRERGLAEALLVGFKDDLDKELVQSYARTGVVHIIAISGMHLALIYGMLMWITYPLKKVRLLRTVIILTGLWLFTLMAGAQASVVRSAVMFTCIAVGIVSGRKSSAFNTLAFSAFVLLCYQPFWLWDIGFQLSYAAVLSILLFYRKFYGILYFPNRSLDTIWKTVAVSLAAQIVTTPLTLYHFHQFPVLFLFTNLLAVPLSGIILFGEIFLCLLAWQPAFARLTGNMLEHLISWMNLYIESIDSISFAVWEGFSLSVLQVILMYIIPGSIAWWVMVRNSKGCYLVLLALLFLLCVRSASFINAGNQQKIIIYNIPRHRAAAIVYGQKAYLFADSNLFADQQAMKTNIFPSVIIFRIKKLHFLTCIPVTSFSGHRVVMYDSTIRFFKAAKKISTDVFILSNHFRQSIPVICNFYSTGWIIADNSVPPWKAFLWKKDCDSLGIHFHYIKQDGAFVMNL